ncbi:Rv1733c family protein [Streptomyces sp. NBC_00306]|uniref:Rv1733c family protein n=1 Tax=Streptomyces sp. NBC_00306 TaxID=2975708 RepID=UPI002E2E2E9A|nr:hypothetical protein [Streptomyces sp. NBC_00306]
MRSATGVWRWRRNPLRRATDLAEAWVALIAALLLVTAAPVAGWIAGSLADASLRQSARTQLENRHQVTATVLRDAPPARASAYDPESAARDKGRAVVARWTAADGTKHTGRISTVLPDPRPGDALTIWTDERGQPAGRPLDAETAQVHAVLAGVVGAFACAGVIESVRRLITWRLLRRRYDRLDRAWAVVGPDWGRAGAGS